jgi:hypothetical protein
MVQRLFADAIHDAIWLMNIHEQKVPMIAGYGEDPINRF